MKKHIEFEMSKINLSKPANTFLFSISFRVTIICWITQARNLEFSLVPDTYLITTFHDSITLFLYFLFATIFIWPLSSFIQFIKTAH